jgi:hypothetical protein
MTAPEVEEKRGMMLEEEAKILRTERDRLVTEAATTHRGMSELCEKIENLQRQLESEATNNRALSELCLSRERTIWELGDKLDEARGRVQYLRTSNQRMLERERTQREAREKAQREANVSCPEGRDEANTFPTIAVETLNRILTPHGISLNWQPSRYFAGFHNLVQVSSPKPREVVTTPQPGELAAIYHHTAADDMSRLFGPHGIVIEWESTNTEGYQIIRRIRSNR